MRRVWLGIVLIGCRAQPPRQPAPPPRPAMAVKAGLPAGFKVVGKPRVELPFLRATDAWRALRSRITTLEADALASREQILVTFEKKAVHATARSGARRTWSLPKGLVLVGVPVHLLLGAAAGPRLFRADHSQVPLGAEVTIVTVHIRRRGRPTEEIRLVIKGGRAIRSISTAG